MILERLRKNRGIDEMNAQCLFFPRESTSCSGDISQNSIDHRLIRCFAAKEDFDSLAVCSQMPSLDNCGQELSKKHGQIGCITVDASEKSTNDNSNYSLSEITDAVAIPEDIYFDTTTEFLKDETLHNQKSEATGRHDLDAKVGSDFVVNENIDDKLYLQLVSISQSDAFIPTLSASSNGSGNKDNANFDNMVENLSISQRNSNVGKEIELERVNGVADNLYKSTSSNSVCKEIKINPKLWDYLDKTRALASTEASGCDIMRLRHRSGNSDTSDSSDSFDMNLTEYDKIYRNKRLSLPLPARTNSRTSSHEQGSSYLNARRAVKSLPVDISRYNTTFANASNDLFVNPSKIISHQYKVQKLTKQCHKSQAGEKNGVEKNGLHKCDFDSRRPDAEISSFRRAGQISNDAEPILHQRSSADLSRVDATLREQVSFEDNSKKLSLSGDVSLRDSDTSVSDSVLDCSEIRDDKSNEADTKQILVSRINLLFEFK